MNIQILLCVASLPIILMCVFIYKKDNDKEPSRILRKLFIFGVFSIIPIVLLELLVDRIMVLDNRNLILLFINVFVGVGLIEEGAKWVIVNKSTFNDKEFNHPYDAIIYSVFASLGFALIENILSVIQNGINIGILRAITTIPLHTFTGILMGYYLGKSKQEDINKNERSAKKYMFLSLIVPILCHTVFDYLIFIETRMASSLFIFMVVFMYIFSYDIVHKISIISKNFDGSKYDSKVRKEYISDSNLFIGSLIKVLVVTLVLIEVSAIIVAI